MRMLALSVAIGALALVVLRPVWLPSGTSRCRISGDLALRLKSYNVIPSSSSLPATYVSQVSLGPHYVSASAVKGKRRPDTAAIILNWSRLQNVILISAVLCGPWLNEIIAEVFIWNNNPNVTLTPETFMGTGCPPEKLRIYNSPSNVLFQARHLACAEARVPFCFTQDDDYLVQPEVIKNLHLYFSQQPEAQSIHLLPAYEHLLSRLRTFTTEDSLITTAFAWLGHGTYLTRSSARTFLDLLRALNVTSEEMNMADNYFTILANRPKFDEIWFDHGVELGGGQPFTVGDKGDNRNDRHIARALEYLSMLVSRQHPAYDHPYVSKARQLGTLDAINIAPCRVNSCIITSNIPLLRSLSHGRPETIGLSSVIRRKLHNLDQAERESYIQFRLSNLVDARPDTAFRSRKAARAGEWIVLDALGIVEAEDRVLELAMLTENGKLDMFKQECTFSTSLDGTEWNQTENGLHCVQVDRFAPLVECSIRLENDARYFKVLVSGLNSRHERWSVQEMWLRYVE